MPGSEADAPAPMPDVEEVIARAVDRQIAEQRALRDTLMQLSNAVSDLQSRPAPAPTPAQVVSSVDTEGVMNELRDLRETLLPGLQRAVDATHGVRVIERDLASLRESVTSLSTDMEGIAQALIDLNAGLRDWADGVDNKVADVRDAADQLRALAEHTTGPQVDEERNREREELDQRVKDSVELQLYLADQVEEFGQAINRIGDLPTKLEGVVGQALKRTLTARAKLDREAETSLDEVLATLDEHVETISGSLSGLTDGEDAIRKLTLGQVELASRVESLHATLLNKLEDLDDERKRANAVLADAIDRIAAGKDAKAAASLDKPAPRQRTTSKPKPKAKSKTKAVLVEDPDDLPPARGSAKATKSKPKPKPRRRAARGRPAADEPLDHIPLT